MSGDQVAIGIGEFVIQAELGICRQCDGKRSDSRKGCGRFHGIPKMFAKLLLG